MSSTDRNKGYTGFKFSTTQQQFVPCDIVFSPVNSQSDVLIGDPAYKNMCQSKAMPVWVYECSGFWGNSSRTIEEDAQIFYIGCFGRRSVACSQSSEAKVLGRRRVWKMAVDDAWLRKND